MNCRLPKLSKITIALASICVFASGSIMAQQDPQLSMYMFNRLPTNAGYAGMNNSICANLQGRQQWMGFEGSPQTAILAIDAPVKLLRGGAGLTIMSDQLGFQKTISAKVAYSYHMEMGPGRLGIGIDAGILNSSMAGDWRATDGVTNDLAIPNTASDILPDLGFGLNYQTNDEKLFFGLSSTHLIEGEGKNLDLKLARHYYILGGYNYEINPSITLRPSLFVKTEASSVQVDLNLNALYNNLLWAGVSYRLTDIAIMAGINYQQLKIGYSYDVTTTQIKGYTSGGHEILVGYCFKIDEKTKSKSKSRNVRFL